MTSQLRATCTCTSTILLRAGALTCATCGAPVVGAGETGRPYTTINLPPDARNPEAFNRACRSGRVRNAIKLGRIWSCEGDDWRSRARAARPRGLPTKASKAMTAKAEPTTRDALLDELGLTNTKRTG